MFVNGTLAAQKVLRNYNNFNNKVTEATKKISSGRRIHTAKEDAAGMAISQKLTYSYRGTRQANKNLQDTMSMFQTAEGGLESEAEILQRMRTLALEAANDTLTNTDRSYLSKEFEELKEQLNYTAFNCKYNDQMLLGPDPVAKGDIVFLLDDSGSCAGEISTIQSNLQDWVDEMFSTFSDVKISVITYANLGGAFMETDLTRDVGAVQTAMAGPAVYQGGGAPGAGEFIYDAIDYAINNVSWDAGYDRFIVGVTDDGAEDENGQPAAVREAVLTQLQNNNAYYYSIDTDPDNGGTGWASHVAGPTTTIGATTYGADDEYQYLTDGTGGIQGNFTDISGALDSIKTSIAANATLVMGDPYNWHAGAETLDITRGSIPLDGRPGALGVANATITTRDNAEAAISGIDYGILRVAMYRSQIGAEMNRINHSINFNGIFSEEMLSSLGKIMDADMGKNIVNLTKNELLDGTQYSLVQGAHMFVEEGINIIYGSQINQR